MSFCVPYVSAPNDNARFDGIINSFVCTPDVFVEALRRYEASIWRESLCYFAAMAAFNLRRTVVFDALVKANHNLSTYRYFVTM